MYLYEKMDKERKREEEYNKLKNNIPKPVNENQNYWQLMGSASHTYGNVLAFAQDYILKLFPDDMFKSIHVNSKIAHRQLRNSEHEYIKKTKPMIIFRPRIGGVDEDKFLRGTQLIKNQTGQYSTWGMGDLQTFFADPVRNISVKFKLNRLVMYIDVVILLSTLMQQLDYYHYLDNRIDMGRPLYEKTFLESYIPQELLKVLSDESHIPLYNKDGNTKEFIEYMNQHSNYPVTYKLQGSTKNKEFFRYYPALVEMVISDLDKDDGDKVGDVMDQYRLNFSVRLEFNATGFYYLFSDNIYDIKLPISNSDDSSYIPMYTDILKKEDIQLQHGWQLYNRASCKLDDPNDTVDLTQLLNGSIIQAIEYHKENGLPLFDLIDIKVRRQGKLIHPNEEYELDYNNYKIIFKNQNTYYTYTFLININVEYVNTLLKTIYNLK